MNSPLLLSVGFAIASVTFLISTAFDRAATTRVKGLKQVALPGSMGAVQGKPPAGPWLKHIGTMAAAGVFGLLVLGPIGLVASLVPPLLIRVARRRAAKCDDRALQEAIPEAADALAEAVRAKGSLRLALAEVASSGPPETRPAFTAVCVGLETGHSIEEAASALANGKSASGFEHIYLAMKLHLASGGNLPASLETAAQWARGKISVERELRAATAQGRFSGLVLVLSPIAFSLLARLTGLGGRFLFASPAGVGVLVAGLLLDAAGFAWIRKVCEVHW